MNRERSAKRKRRRSPAEKSRPLLRLAGICVLIGTAMLAVASIAPVYRWFRRSDYLRTAVDVMSTPSGAKHLVEVRVVSDGREYLVPALEFSELRTGGVLQKPNVTPGRRFEVWYNPEAPRFVDRKLLSLEAHPNLVTGTEIAIRTGLTLALLSFGAFLIWASIQRP